MSEPVARCNAPVLAEAGLVKGRDAELEAMGIADRVARSEIIAKEERGIAEQALKDKRSPSQMLYNLAKARGYAPSTDRQTWQTDPNDARVAAIAKGQRVAGASLSGSGGSSGEGLTAETLAAMSQSEFDAVMGKLTATQRRPLLGG